MIVTTCGNRGVTVIDGVATNGKHGARAKPPGGSVTHFRPGTEKKGGCNEKGTVLFAERERNDMPCVAGQASDRICAVRFAISPRWRMPSNSTLPDETLSIFICPSSPLASFHAPLLAFVGRKTILRIRRGLRHLRNANNFARA